jgi:phosphohistidine phosphatase
MRLVLFRHGTAEPREGYRGGADAERPLTPEGRTRTRRAARGLAKELGPVTAIATSPYRRARETAALLAAAFEVKPTERAGLEPGGEIADLEAWLAEQPADAVAIAVGHEPGLGLAASWFLAGVTTSFAPLKKAGAIALDFEALPAPGTASLAFAWTGKQLRRAGR